MCDDEWTKLFQDETPYLEDDGFTAGVMERLPVKRQWRGMVMAAVWVVGIWSGGALWLSGGAPVSYFPGSSPVFLLTASGLGLLVAFGLFAFVAFDEGIVEVG